MEIIGIQTEQTTALTDALMGVMAAAVYFYLGLLKRYDKWKVTLWRVIFFLLIIASFLGTVAHGIKMDRAVNDLFWLPLSFVLGLMVSLFVVGVIYDSKGQAAARKAIPVMAGAACFFFMMMFVLSKFIEGYFLVFIVYEASAMFYALVIYSRLALKEKQRGAGFMTAGIFMTIIAAFLQATRAVSFTLVWEFDHNSVFHLVQMAAMLFLLKGIKNSLQPC